MMCAATSWRRTSGVLAVLVGALAVAAASARADVLVTRDATAGSYVRYDGQSDATTGACSTGRRSQNEPSIAVDPGNVNVVVAGSNDYCAQIVNGDVWVGYYRSTDGGATWRDSLVPGYPADESAAGLASPAHGSCGAAGDPTQAFDREGRLFYGFICFNRAKPVNGSTYVATYDQHGGRYVRTVLVDSGSPSAQFAGSGLFQDKINLAVDQTTGATGGNVYVAWARYSGKAANNVILFSRSTDHGQTFSRPVRISPGLAQEQFADTAVGPDGAVYVTYRTYAAHGRTGDAVWVVKSTDGGQTFGPPGLVATFTPFTSADYTGGTGGVDCGDGLFACPSGLTFSRFDSLSAVAADTRGVHVVWSARQPSGQAKIFVRNSPDGVTWPTPATTVDAVPVGHQWFPDIGSAGGTVTVIFYDSRQDPSYAPSLPPGDTAGGTNSGDVVRALVARSSDGGVTWSEAAASGANSNFGWETHGARRIGFWGDYNYVSAVPGAVQVAWTDSRDLVAGADPRETGATDDHDGFDVFQPCVYVPNDINAASYTSPAINDPCLSQSGLDQNIYATAVP
jgi:hypothetical protein